MKSVSRWLDRGRLHTSSSAQSLDSLAESQNLESALRAVELIMDDDIEGAERGLGQGNSAFHQLCRGVIGFMKATMGFEQDTMREASAQLSAAETSAYNELYRAQKSPTAVSSNIYDKGSEFVLCQAEAQIMSAIVGVLNESLTESLKGFYKLRKAYTALNGLIEMEKRFIKTRGVHSLASSRPQSSESFHSNVSNTPHAGKQPANVVSDRTGDEAHANQPSGLRQAENAETIAGDGSDDEEDFFDVNNVNEKSEITKSYTGKLETFTEDPAATKEMSNLSLLDSTRPGSSLSSVAIKPNRSYDLITADPSDPIFSFPLDIFIHSGANLFFGLVSLLISAIPPAFSRLLSIIGFRGDRDRGMRMLWQASKFSNINGGMAGLVILGWYNGLNAACDIIPDLDHNDEEQIEGYPVKRLKVLLAEMRRRYPRSHLWLIEEARMTSACRNLEGGIAILSQPTAGKSQLKQLESLHVFEKSLSAMAAHQYELCSESFLKMVELNSWSQALYYYIAGSAHLSLYRDLKTELISDTTSRSKEDIGTEMSKQAKLAEEYFRTAPTKTGKKKMMGRQLPLDIFVSRKIAKWTAHAEAWGCDFVDAVGVSPLEEMTLLWNGYKRMNATQLKTSLQNLAWSEGAANLNWDQEELDERAILALLRAVIYRNLREHEKAREILRDEILCHEKSAFKGLNRDDWVAPTAHYEMGVNAWMLRSGYLRQNGPGIVSPDCEEDVGVVVDLVQDAQLVAEAKGWIEKVRGWEKYELDARMGMKVTAGYNAIKKWEEEHAKIGVAGK